MTSDLRRCARNAAVAASKRQGIQKKGITPNGHAIWSEREIQVLRDLFPDYETMKRCLNRRTSKAIHGKCEKLGLSRKGARPWTAAQISGLM